MFFFYDLQVQVAALAVESVPSGDIGRIFGCRWCRLRRRNSIPQPQLLPAQRFTAGSSAPVSWTGQIASRPTVSRFFFVKLKKKVGASFGRLVGLAATINSGSLIRRPIVVRT